MNEFKKKPAIQPRVENARVENGWPDAPIAPDNASELERLTYPPGLAGHVIQYMIDTARLPDRWMALGTTMSILGKGIDRKVIGPNGHSNTTYDAVIASTTAGKQHKLNCGIMILRAMGVQDCYRAGGIASVQAIEELIDGRHNDEDTAHPNSLVVIDELGSWLSRISTKQGGNVSEIPGTLSTLFGWPPSDAPWMGSAKVGKDVKGIYSPAFSLLGFTTKEKFFACLKRSDGSQGFINRLSIWEAANDGRGWLEDSCDPKYPWTQIPHWLGAAFKQLTSGLKEAPAHEPMLMELGEVVVRDFVRLGWGDGAEQIHKEFEKSIRQMPDEEDKEIWGRAAEIAVRNATKVAFFRGSRTVDVCDISWAVAVATKSGRQLQDGYNEHSKDDLDQADLVKRIRDEFKRKGRLTWGQIRKSCERRVNDYRKIDAAIYHLKQMGDIIEEKPEDKSEWRGRPTDAWLYTRKKPSFK